MPSEPWRFMSEGPGKGGFCWCGGNWGKCDHTSHIPDHVNKPIEPTPEPKWVYHGDNDPPPFEFHVPSAASYPDPHPASTNAGDFQHLFPHPNDLGAAHPGYSDVSGGDAGGASSSYAPSSVGATYGGSEVGSTAGSAMGDFNTTAATYGGSDTASVAESAAVSGLGSASGASIAGVDTTAATYGGSDIDTASVVGSVADTIPSHVGSEL